MKKGIFIVYGDISQPGGVIKKIKNQIKAFQDSGLSVAPYWMKTKEISGYKLLYRLPFTNLSPAWEWDKAFEKIDFIYFRRPFFMNLPLLLFLKKARKKNPHIKIIMEIPTYPYDKEILKNKRNLPVYLKEILARRRIHRYIDRIALLTDEKRIFGIPTVKIENGFDFADSRVKNHTENGEIHLAAVALFDMWHGYERIIESLKEYYAGGGERKIHIHFVGDGPERETYQTLVNQYGLQAHVSFYGMQGDAFIREIYDLCGAGLCSFGLFKKDLDFSCELKSREYLAAGLPIITGCTLDIMKHDVLNPYILSFPNDPSSVSMEAIIAFYDQLYSGKTGDEIRRMNEALRTFAVEHLDMKTAMRPIIDELKRD